MKLTKYAKGIGIIAFVPRETVREALNEVKKLESELYVFRYKYESVAKERDVLVEYLKRAPHEDLFTEKFEREFGFYFDDNDIDKCRVKHLIVQAWEAGYEIGFNRGYDQGHDEGFDKGLDN